MKISKQDNGTIVIKNSNNNILNIISCDVFVGLHPRVEGAVLISKNASNQQEADSIAIYASKITEVNGNAFNGDRNALMLALSEVFNTAGQSSATSTRQEMHFITPRITGELTTTSWRAMTSVSGYGSDSMTNISDSTAITSSNLPKVNLVNQDGLKLKSIMFNATLMNGEENICMHVIAKECVSVSEQSSPPLISSQIIATCNLVDIGYRGSVYEFVINSNYVLKKNMVIEVYYGGILETNSVSLDLRAPLCLLRFEK